MTVLQSSTLLLRHPALAFPRNQAPCPSITDPRSHCPYPLAVGKRGNRPKRTSAVAVIAASSSAPAPSPQPRQPRLRFRRGLQEDAGTIFKAILNEKMNPLGLKPERFLVAEEEEEEEEGDEADEGASGRGKKIVAFGQLAELDDAGTLLELRSLVTSPEWRGRGIGAKVVEGLLEEAATRRKMRREGGGEGGSGGGSGAQVVLTTIARRRGFYERLGFEELPIVPEQLKLEVALGSVMARLAVGDSIIVLGKRV